MVERTRSHPQTATYNQEQEPIVISKALLDELLSQDHPADLIALYCFYYYTAKWQKTNRPKCTTSYTAKGLQWSLDRVRKRKQQLIKLNLVQDLASRDPVTQRITGRYIMVKFIWSKETLTMENPYYGNTLSKENSEVNALSSNSINALSSNKEIPKGISVSDETPKNNNIPKQQSSQNNNHKKSSYVERWNSFQATPNHKNPSSKVYQKGAKYFSQLVHGTFWDDKAIDGEWWNKNKFPNHWTSKKWTPQDLLKGLEDLSKLFTEGYWPPDKSKLPRSLPDLMYNPHTSHSFLFLVLKNSPQPVRNENPKDNHPELTRMVVEKFDMGGSRILIDQLAKMAEFNENNIGNNGNYSKKVRDKYPKGNARPLLKDYIHWLELQDWVTDINAIAFNPQGKLFRKFIDYASNNYIGVDLVEGTPLWM